MSSSAAEAQAQWLEQFAAMRKAIAELDLPRNSYDVPVYNSNIDLDNDDLSGITSSEEIWDIISDEDEDDYSSDQYDPSFDAFTPKGDYGQQWLTQKCAGVAQLSSGLDAGSLREQISAILASDSSSRAPVQAQRISHLD